MDEKPKGNKERVKVWIEEIRLAKKNQEDWHKDAEEVLKIYRSDSQKKGNGDRRDTFNILWSNTEIKRQALYNSLPSPNIRRRYQDKDPVGKAVSEILKRAVNYTLDCNNTHNQFIYTVNDMLLTGRGGMRVRYSNDKCETEHYQWDSYLEGAGDTWEDKLWVGFSHELYRDEAVERFGKEKADALTYKTLKEDKKNTEEKEVLKKTTVYEIWDKETDQVLWIGEGYEDDFLDVIDDPLEIKQFYPIPRPLYAIEDPTNTVPIIEFNQYRTLAKELENVTRRILKMEDAVRVRGIYDPRISELDNVFDSEENELIPAENVSALIEGGGIEKGIWFVPIDVLVQAIQVLEQQRDRLSQKIYEITGISDIVRGDTNPNETLGAQQIKANFASARMERQKQAVEIFARDFIRLIVEVVSTLPREVLSKMTGLNYPTAQDQEIAKMQVQFLGARLQQMQQAAQQNPQFQQQIGPTIQQMQQQMQQAQSILSQVNWEQIEEILGSDLSREYRIDVETDSTITSDRQRDQEAITHYLNAMGQFQRFTMDGVQSGIMSLEAAKKIMIEVSRKFDLSEDIEEALEMEVQPRPDPAAEERKMEMEFKKQEHQMDMMKSQMELQAKQQEAKLDAVMAKLELMLDVKKAQIEAESLKNKEEYEEAKHEREMEKLEEKEDA